MLISRTEKAEWAEPAIRLLKGQIIPSVYSLNFLLPVEVSLFLVSESWEELDGESLPQGYKIHQGRKGVMGRKRGAIEAAENVGPWHDFRGNTWAPYNPHVMGRLVPRLGASVRTSLPCRSRAERHQDREPGLFRQHVASTQLPDNTSIEWKKTKLYFSTADIYTHRKSCFT